MGLKRSKKALVAGLGLLLSASTSFSNVLIDDFDDGNNMSKVDGPWYFYTDVNNNGSSTIESEQTNPTFFGDYPGKDDTYGAAMSFELGDTAGMDAGVKPYVVFGYNFAPQPSKNARAPYDLTGATAISFYVKGDKEFKARLYMELTPLGPESGDYDDYYFAIPVTEEWTRITATMDASRTGFKRENWGETVVSWDLTKIAQMSFKVRRNENASLASGTLFIDSVVIEGDPVFKLAGEIEPEETGSYSGDGLLCNFDNSNKTIFKKGWYSYTDKTISLVNPTKITGGIDEETGMVLGDGIGMDESNGITLDILFGDAIPNGQYDPIQPFCGISTDLLKNTGDAFYNAKGEGATGVYVEYKSDAYVFVELADTIVRGDDACHYVILPPTKGEWKGAEAKFSDFILPNWDGIKTDALKTGALTQLKFKVQGKAGATGSFSVDNIYLKDATITSVIPIKNKLAPKGVVINQSRDAIKVNFNNSINNARVSLINPLGKIVNNQSITAKSKSCSVPLMNNASGVYLLKITADNGLVETAPLHILR